MDKFSYYNSAPTVFGMFGDVAIGIVLGTLAISWFLSHLVSH